jgi:ankyrin repeat protein
MIQPDELTTDEPLLWSTGTGIDVWALFSAIVGNDPATVRRLAEKDPAIVRCHHAYRTPIYFAVRENRLAIAEFLLDHGADPLSLAVNDSMLEICRDRGYGEMERLLASKLLSIHNASPRGNPVAAAIRARDVAEVRSLLDADPGLLHAGDERSNQPIHWATMTRQLDLIDELLERGADIDARRYEGARPIHLYNGDYHYRGWRDVPGEIATKPREVLAHLIARGAYVDICTAAHMGNLDRVHELVEQDASLANRVSDYISYYLGSGSPLRNAAATGRLEVVRFLLDHGADPNLNEEGIAPHGGALHAASAGGHYEVAKLLLERGAYPSAEVESSADCLSFAIMNKDQQMIDLLTSYGATRPTQIMSYYGDVAAAEVAFAGDPSLADNPEALSNAASEGNEAFVRLLLQYQPGLASRVAVAGKTPEITRLLFAHGMNPSLPNWLHITPLHHHAASGELGKARCFIEHGADLHARDEDLGSTPLAWAAKFGQKSMVELLLRSGAKPVHPDDPDWATPRAWATRRGHAEIAEVLRKAEDGVLPAAPTLQEYERLAQDILAAYRTGDAGALQRIRNHARREVTLEQLRAGVRDSLEKDPGGERPRGDVSLEDARRLVARWLGFESWPALVDWITFGQTFE